MDKKERIAILKHIVKINTENGNEGSVAKYFQELLNNHGIESKLIEFSPGRSNLVSEISNETGKTLALTGHMDVVNAGDESKWTHPPFSAHIEEDVIWGRGTSDMKSGLAALVIAFIELNESRRFKGRIKLLATVGEEIGELGSKQLTDLGYADGIDAMLIGEPCNVGIVYAHKGSLNYKVISKGVAAHSSTPELGSNAIEHLTAAMTMISERIASKAEKYENPVLGKTYNNITLIRGGVQVNSIPDYAEFEANARTIPEFDNLAVIKEVKAVINELNQKEHFDLDVVITADQYPVETDPNSTLVQTIIEVTNSMESLSVKHLLKSMGDVIGEDLNYIGLPVGEKQPLAPISTSGTTDAAQFIRANKNLELAVYGPGMPMLNHKINERLPIEQYLDFIEAYKLIIEKYLSVK